MLADKLAQPLGDEAAADLQHHGGRGQLLLEPGVMQGQIDMGDGLRGEAQLRLHIGQQRPAQVLGQRQYGGSILGAGDLSGDDDTRLAGKLAPRGVLVIGC